MLIYALQSVQKPTIHLACKPLRTDLKWQRQDNLCIVQLPAYGRWRVRFWWLQNMVMELSCHRDPSVCTVRATPCQLAEAVPRPQTKLYHPKHGSSLNQWPCHRCHSWTVSYSPFFLYFSVIHAFPYAVYSGTKCNIDNYIRYAASRVLKGEDGDMPTYCPPSLMAAVTESD